VTRECLGTIPVTSISGRRVARELTAIIGRRGRPRMVVSEHGTELACNAMLAWSKDKVIDGHFIAPRRPMQSGFIESINGRVCPKLLNQTLFSISTMPAPRSPTGSPNTTSRGLTLR